MVQGFSSTSRSATTVTLTDALSSKLNDPSLLLDWALHTTTSTNATTNHPSSSTKFGVYDPASPATLLAEVPSVNNDQQAVDNTLRASHDILENSWRDSTTAAFRGSLLREWSRLMLQEDTLRDLATIMTLESGKPLAESMGEVKYAASFLDYFAAEAVRSTNAGGGFLVPTPFVQPQDGTSPRGQILARHQAVGLTAMITPWNFPSAMLTRKVGPALAAGCTAVVKPSELTPLSAIALATLAYRAGIPRDVVSILTASTDDTPSVGAAFCANPLVQKISFTGSTKVGKWLMEQSSSTVKRLSLELGGNAPFVVFGDADLDQAVTAAIASKFRNAGQTCVCADRFLVHSSIHDEFVEKLVAQTQQLQVGAGMDVTPTPTTMGPLITPTAVDSITTKVEQALSMGATLRLGGNRLEGLGPHFYEPTILTGVPVDADLWKTETFGPVVAIHTFDRDDQALAIANDSSVGLAAYFCTNNLSRAFSFSQRLECGIVGVNEGIISSASAPFGGVKESGLGREGSSMGLAEYLETKYIFMNY